MNNRPRDLVYADSGELYEKKERYFMVCSRLNFTQDRRLTLTDIRIFGYLCEIMLKDGHILHTQAFICRKLGMTSGNFSNRMKHLRDLDYIGHGTYKGRKVTRVNPLYCSKRSAAHWKAEECTHVAEDLPEYK